MSEKEKTIAKIKEAIYENVNRKLEEEQKLAENKINNINNEMLKIETCLQYIKNKMVFKVIEHRYRADEYNLADEDMFFEDYAREPLYDHNKGVHIYDINSKPYRPLFQVNGESYYDIRYIINKYENQFDLCSKQLDDLNNQMNNLNDKFKEATIMAYELKKQEPYIKKLIEQYKSADVNEPYVEHLRPDDLPLY